MLLCCIELFMTNQRPTLNAAEIGARFFGNHLGSDQRVQIHNLEGLNSTDAG
jgi:hypothetical protein